MNPARNPPPPIPPPTAAALRFSTRRLLQAVTVSAVLAAVGVVFPPWLMPATVRVVDIALLGALIAGVLTFHGRGRTASVAALAALIWLRSEGYGEVRWPTSGAGPLAALGRHGLHTATIVAQWLGVGLCGLVGSFAHGRFSAGPSADDGE